GSKPITACASLTTNSAAPPGTSTSTGVFHDELMSLVRHTSLPVFLSSPTRAPLSMLALMMTKSWKSTGELDDPQPLVFLPTLSCQISLPSRSRQYRPDLPKKA